MVNDRHQEIRVMALRYALVHKTSLLGLCSNQRRRDPGPVDTGGPVPLHGFGRDRILGTQLRLRTVDLEACHGEELRLASYR